MHRIINKSISVKQTYNYSSKNYAISTMQLHNFFEEQLYVFFTSLNLSHYTVHKCIEIQLLKNESSMRYFTFYV